MLNISTTRSHFISIAASSFQRTISLLSTLFLKRDFFLSKTIKLHVTWWGQMMAKFTLRLIRLFCVVICRKRTPVRSLKYKILKGLKQGVYKATIWCTKKRSCNHCETFRPIDKHHLPKLCPIKSYIHELWKMHHLIYEQTIFKHARNNWIYIG